MRRSEDSTRTAPIEAVSFDVTQTLIHCPRLGEIYREVLARHGIAIAPKDVRRVVPKVWREFSCRIDPRRDRFSLHPRGEQGWWHRFLKRVCRHLETGPPTRFASAELFDRFARPSAWEVYPDVVPVLETLAAAGLRLAVVSNWDHRLPGLLDRLGLGHCFDAVAYSAACGVEKPHPMIFERALRELGVAPERAIHVGDHPLEDVEGAEGAGMGAVRVDRQRPDTDLRRLLVTVLRERMGTGGPAGRAGPPHPADGGRGAGLGGPRSRFFPVLFTSLLAATIWAGGCRRSGEEQTPPETVDVGPSLVISTENDPTEVERKPALIGVLPADFPEDLPLYLPASLTDFGAGDGGWRFVELLTSHSVAQADAGLAALVSESGWATSGSGDGGRLLRKGNRQVRLRIQDGRPGAYYRYEYR